MSSENGSRIVVTGATGNVGTSLVRLLSEDPEVDSVLGVARRIPEWFPEKTSWTAVDLSAEDTDLAEEFAGATAVVHLAWAFQPTHDPAVTWRTNVLGSTRVFEAVAAARVPTLVHASSVGAYSPGPKDHAVDESWPTHGWPGAAYCREKAYLERALDSFERVYPETRVVRMRPAFLFKKESASEQRRIFGGRFLPGQLARPELLPVLPDIPGLRCRLCTPMTRRRRTGWACGRMCAGRSIWRPNRRSMRRCSASCWGLGRCGCRTGRRGPRSLRHGACICCPPHRICSMRCFGCR